MNAAEMEVIEEEVIRNVDWRNISNISNIMVKGVGQEKARKGKELTVSCGQLANREIEVM